MWLPRDEDPRSYGSPVHELETYREYLTNYRLTLELKCQGLTPEQLATRSVPPSNLSLLGLVRHMASVENGWFQRLKGGERTAPHPYADDSDPDHDFNGAAGTQECVDDAFATWKAEIAAADAWLEDQTDDGLAEMVPLRGDNKASRRDILVHMIEEYARHCGHADLLRECIDGRTGQ